MAAHRESCPHAGQDLGFATLQAGLEQAMVGWRGILGVAAIALAAGGVAAPSGTSTAQERPSSDEETSELEIVVTGYQDIVVNGRAIRCRRAAGDPLDSVRIGGSSQDYTMIVPDGAGDFVAKQVTEQITGPQFWQRVGVGIGAYTFRAPEAGKPMCIGGRGDGNGFGGFRRIVDAAPFRGRRLRFTAWAATGRAGQVSFWLAAGSSPVLDADGNLERDRLLNGGNTNNVRFGGNHDWTPILLETGPVHADAGHISYGFNLQGGGDVWIYEPRLEVVSDQQASSREEDLVVIGRPAP